MVSVASLLNDEMEEDQLTPTPTASSRYASECSPAPSDFERPSKKPRLAKDQALFVQAGTNGPVRYAPYNTSDRQQLEEMKELKVTPLEEFVKCPRHIPYNSERRGLFQKTGRKAFEVFQYTFQPRGHEKPYVVIWDYNIGLVRMTPFFKCKGFNKTLPKRMLDKNPGLSEWCHSITGGALVAQGYWVPFEASRALASAFVWDFRHALIPIFGPDFPAMCAKPGSAAFEAVIIDNEIVTMCAEKLTEYRDAETKHPASKIEELSSDARDSPSSSSRTWFETSRYRSSFTAVNHPTSTPAEASAHNSYAFLRQPVSTPPNSCRTSPSMSNQKPLSTLVSPFSLLSPSRTPDRHYRDDKAPSPPPNSPDSAESSGSNVSPKTTPRKRRRGAATCQQLPIGDIAKSITSQEDIKAASILMTLRDAVAKAREEMEIESDEDEDEDLAQ